MYISTLVVVVVAHHPKNIRNSQADVYYIGVKESTKMVSACSHIHPCHPSRINETGSEGKKYQLS